ncbi:cysteine-rich KTR domain-containing protein [Roseburia lenta]
MKYTYLWKECPHCGNPKMIRLRSDTQLKNFPAYCKYCKRESIVTIEPKSQIVNS